MITLLTTHCPSCKILEKKLQENNIPYKEIDNEEEIIKYGVMSVPVIVTENNELIDFAKAIQLLKSSEKIKELGG